ncbi:MAG: hypothetical protein IKW83_10850 [Muribaculaceae bacterium]|nr:hypothetical protein [Muribaculaceae bacterium]
MALFKNIFSVTALVAVLSFSSVSVSAQPMSLVKERTPDKDYLLGESDTKVSASQSFKVIFDKPTIGSMIKRLNHFGTPLILGDGIELSSVDMDMDEDIITFNATCDYETFVTIEEFEEDELEEFVQSLEVSLYEIFNTAGFDDNGDSLVKRLQDMNITVNYNFYIKNIGVIVKTFTINAQSIENAGLIANNIYSI